MKQNGLGEHSHTYAHTETKHSQKNTVWFQRKGKEFVKACLELKFLGLIFYEGKLQQSLKKN